MIGVFDSGFGGLTILKEFLNHKDLRNYDYIYLGDNARAPYGGKSQDVIFRYTLEAVKFLLDKKCQLIIIACNTASAEALRRIQIEFINKNNLSQRVLGVVIPVAEHAARLAEKQPDMKLGLIGTKSTIESKAYDREIKKFSRRKLRLAAQACPLLVPLVEEGWSDKPETLSILYEYLLPLKKKEIDQLILGCTHYPLLMKHIRQILDPRTKVINPPKIVADSLADYLERHKEINNKLSKKKRQAYYTTDDIVKFKKASQKFLGRKIGRVDRADLDKYGQ